MYTKLKQNNKFPGLAHAVLDHVSNHVNIYRGCFSRSLTLRAEETLEYVQKTLRNP